ncbi:MAG: hypothetical protein AAF481_10485 [Acidobacteriota bacterium]
MSATFVDRKRWIAGVLLVAMALVGTLVSLSWAEDANALPCRESDRTYYSSAAKTTIVGEVIVTCWGVFRWGTTSPYSDYYPGETCPGCGGGW